jgi:hypothetical protein
MESPKTAVTSLAASCAESGADENAVCMDETRFGVNVPRRRKIADGFSLESLKELLGQAAKNGGVDN